MKANTENNLFEWQRMFGSVSFLNYFLVIVPTSKYIGFNCNLQLNKSCKNEKENLLRFLLLAHLKRPFLAQFLKEENLSLLT